MKAVLLRFYEWWEKCSMLQHFLYTVLAVILIMFLFSNLIFLPMSQGSLALDQQLMSERTTLTQVQLQQTQLHDLVKTTSIPNLTQRNAVLQKEYEASQTLGIDGNGKGASAAIVNYLEILLNANQDLTLLSIEHSTTELALNTAAKTAATEAKKAEALAPVATPTNVNTPKIPSLSTGTTKPVIRQNFNLSFTGNFFSVLNYLATLEKSPMRFFNDELDYQVATYPIANITLKIHTLNT